MAQASGMATIVLDSDTLRSKAGASFQPGGINREYDMTDQLESYYREKPVPAMIKCTMVHMTDTDLIKLRNWKDGTAYFRTDTGVLYTVPKAGTASIGDLSNGEVEVTIMGDPAT